MSKMRLVVLTVAALALTATTAGAVNIDGKKGVGYARAIGGPRGLAFNFGTGNLAIEGILGAEMLMPKDGDGSQAIGIGAGVHFMALRAENAALSVGGRVNVGLGKAPLTVISPAKQESITQFGIDIPVRVYWFPDQHISLHIEMGIAVILNPEFGNVFAANGAGAEGTDIVIFDSPLGANSFGNIGMTFWW